MKPTVSIIQCTNYNPASVEAAVRRAVDLVGGIRSYVKARDRVLLKPNILSARRPEEAVCTHPEVLRAVIRIVKETGAQVIVGDSPGGFLKDIAKVYDVSGITKVAREEKVDLVKFTFSRTIKGFPISIRVLDADKVISIPKFKTHEITGITAAVKNMYGTVVGLHKTKCHADAPTEKSMAKIIAKVFSITKPCLSILDAVVSMEGEGPSAGDPRKTNFVMASRDSVAIDSMLAHLIKTKPFDYAVIKECKRMGLGETHKDNIDLVGDEFSDFVIKDFKHARGRLLLKFLPFSLTTLISSQLKFWPEIDTDACKKCNMCRSSCPVHAIYVNKRAYFIDRKKCVRCMCCREVCPYKCVMVKKNWLARMLWE